MPKGIGYGGRTPVKKRTQGAGPFTAVVDTVGMDPEMIEVLTKARGPGMSSRPDSGVSKPNPFKSVVDKIVKRKK